MIAQNTDSLSDIQSCGPRISMKEPETKALLRLSSSLSGFLVDIESVLPKLRVEVIAEITDAFEALIAPLVDSITLLETTLQSHSRIAENRVVLSPVSRSEDAEPTEFIDVLDRAVALNQTLRTVIVEIGFTITLTSSTLDQPIHKSLSCLLAAAENARRSLDELASRIEH